MSDVLRVPAAAEVLGVSESTVLRAARSGRIPARKLGSIWVFSQSKLEEWVAAGMAPKGREADADPMPRPRNDEPRLREMVTAIQSRRAS